MNGVLPVLLGDRSDEERLSWSRWVLGSHSDQFIPEMLQAIEVLDRHDPITAGHPVVNPGPRAEDLIVIACAYLTPPLVKRDKTNRAVLW